MSSELQATVEDAFEKRAEINFETVGVVRHVR